MNRRSFIAAAIAALVPWPVKPKPAPPDLYDIIRRIPTTKVTGISELAYAKGASFSFKYAPMARVVRLFGPTLYHRKPGREVDPRNPC